MKGEETEKEIYLEQNNRPFDMSNSTPQNMEGVTPFDETNLSMYRPFTLKKVRKKKKNRLLPTVRERGTV